MSDIASTTCSATLVDNPYIVILSKRIRAYKKKVERINTIRTKTVIDADQKDLCSNFDLYNSILTELRNIHAQYLNYSKQEHTTPVELKEVVVSEDVKEEEHAPIVVEQVIEEPAPAVVEVVIVEEEKNEEEIVVLPSVVEEEKQQEDASPVVEDVKKERKPRFDRRRRQGDKSDEHQSRYPRSGKSQGARTTPKYGVSKKDQEDGWFVPKKVVYVKQQQG